MEPLEIGLLGGRVTKDRALRLDLQKEWFPEDRTPKNSVPRG